MPAGDASTEGQVHDLYVRAWAARQRAELLAGELAESRRKTRETLRLMRDSRGKTVRLRAWRQAYRTDQEWLRYSEYARLRARLATLPLIEQAKGILMARYGWPADLAFEVLRRVSQRENVKVRELAAGIVARTVRPAPAQRQPAGTAPTAPQWGGDFAPWAGSGGARNRYWASA